MSNTTVKLQIPLEKSLRDKVEKHARAQGFSSVQDFTRVIYSTIVRRNLKFNLGNDDTEELSPETIAKLDRLAEQAMRNHKAGKLKSFDDSNEALAYLNSL